MLNQSRWPVNATLIFISSTIALGLSLFLYIYWYVQVREGVKVIARRFNIDQTQFLESQTWLVIMVLSILVGIILLGIFVIFVYHQKTFQLYRLQNNFINNFTHELKTPVTSMKLYLETFARYELPREQSLKYIQYMLSDVNRLSDNISDILNLARLESKSYMGEFEEVDLADEIWRFCDRNVHMFKDCQIQIDNPAGDKYFYRVNRPLFEMLLMNLLGNAVKYNNSNVPRIDVIFELAKRRLLIRFRDNGIGIEKKNLKKIFKKFFQAGQSDDRTAKGSGLGLYLVKTIVVLHKAKVRAESEGLGKGAEFILSLPRKRLRMEEQII
jgi:two-component system, OmpR family, phosphate regulon sensor histidine kinase PhoR